MYIRSNRMFVSIPKCFHVKSYGHSTNTIINFFFPVVTVNISEPSYVVDEGDGQVEVCVALTGQIARIITVTLDALPGTASGGLTEFCIYH